MDDKWKSWYAALKAVEPEAYQKAIQYGEGISLTFNLPLKQAAEVERAFIMQACELLGVSP